MRKQTRQYLRRIFCGVLSAAMILSGSAISGMTAYAAEPDVENEGGGLTDDVDDSKDTIQNPADGAVTDDENGTDGDGSNQEDADNNTQTGDDATQPGDSEGSGNSGSDENGDMEDSDEEGTWNGGLEDSDAEAGDEDVKDPDAEDEAEEDDKTIIKKDDEEVSALKSARAEYGTLVNGDFEGEFVQVGNVWVPNSWKFTPDFTGNDGNGFKTKTIDSEHGNNSLYIYKIVKKQKYLSARWFKTWNRGFIWLL